VNVFALGLSNKTSAVEVREKLAFRQDELADAMQKLKSREGVLECLILSTCNRVEVYALLADVAPSVLATFLRDYHGLDEEIGDKLYMRQNEAALSHLCRVAAGVDSMIVGEPQIFGQVKEAYKIAVECGTAGIVFKSLFPQAFTLVKTVRSRTDIGRANVSVSSAAVSFSRKTLGDLSGKTVLIIGAGEIGELTVRNLVKTGVGHVFVCNRTFERAVRVAEAFKGTPVMLHELQEYLSRADIAITSIDAPSYILRGNDITPRQFERPLLILDLSVPRAVDPKVEDTDGVHLFDVDDLEDVVRGSRDDRQREAEKAGQIIDGKVEAIWRKLDSADLSPMILSLKETAERIRVEALSSYARDTDVCGHDRETLELLTRSIVNKVVHHAIVMVREYSNSVRYK
jgi:glutamyl-tRNA reductase